MVILTKENEVDFNLKIPSIAFNFTEVWIRIL
jgi:hypothetical protein